MKDEAERQRSNQVDQEMPGEIRQPVGSQNQLERELEKKHRANRQIGPCEKLMLPHGKPRRRHSLEQDLNRDQGEEDQDQDQDRIFEDRDEPAAKERLHSQGQQFLLPRGSHAARASRCDCRARRWSRSTAARSPSPFVERRAADRRSISVASAPAAVAGRTIGFSGRRAQRRHDSARASRSSRISSSRVTAKRSGISSRNATVSFTSSTAVWTIVWQAAARSGS